uniref:U2A'/phosphoprotein 32 family A C-terminal domain-containing protein n=1 Tax=Salix viminalis TaxID=40686 RepID=A0A6N2LYW4_SALVM
MATDIPSLNISTLEQMYIDSCKRHGVPPHKEILSGFLKVSVEVEPDRWFAVQAEVKKSCNEICSLEIILDHLEDIDVPPLLDVCASIETSEIEVVDIRNGPLCALQGEYALSLMRAFNQKLQLVDLQDLPFGKDFLRFIPRELSRKGLTCQILNLRSSHLRKLNMAGTFMQIRRLFYLHAQSNLPLNVQDRVDLWTTIAALSKLSSLVELRFQKWLCCNDSASPSASSGGNLEDEPDVGQLLTDIDEESYLNQEFDYMDQLANLSSGWNRQVNLRVELSSDTSWNNKEESLQGSSGRHNANVRPNYISHHASPICSEKHYREYMIASLPNLKVLDNLAVRKIDSKRAAVTFSQHFEYLPYNRKRKESVVDILHRREIKDTRSHMRSKNQKPSYSHGNSQYSYTRSLCAAKLGSSAKPLLHSLSVSGCDSGDKSMSFRPRQFEYHPSLSSLMAFGTLDGEVVVVNHENEKVVRRVSSPGAMNSVLGLCWLKKYPSKLIAGSDSGSLKLYDIEHVPPPVTGMYSGAGSIAFDDFDQLTSVHVNSTDELFLASGYSKNVALYDISSGRRVQVFTDMHREHINVVKFSNHSPSVFATSSFDQDVKLWDLRLKPVQPCYTTSSSRGNVMVCFSPDDHYLLASAFDNEVRQLLAVDGRLHLSFDIAPTGSSQNYTRSYYMNGRDYIISGSCDEHVVRVCCAQTGRRLRDISLEGKGLGNSMYVQSLRGDPFRDFNMSILAAYTRPNSKYEIVKVNLLESCGNGKGYSKSRDSCTSKNMGG